MTLLRLSGSALAALSLAAASAAEPETPPAAMPPPPDIMRNKPPISELLLKEKREGAYFTGLPLVGVTPESGVIYGGTNQWYDNGPKDSPFFADAPYRKKINAQIDLGTKGRQEYILEYDQPYIADTPWRVRASGAYLVYEFEDYFGVGEDTLGPLRFPGTPGVTYTRANDYFDALDANRGGRNWSRYNYYDRRQTLFALHVERDYLGGLLRPLAGFQISHVDVRDYTGRTIEGGSIRKPSSAKIPGAGKSRDSTAAG